MRCAVIVLAWARLGGTFRNLTDLSTQTYSDFKLVVSCSNPELTQRIEQKAKSLPFKDAVVREDSNDEYAFRRLRIARELAQEGYEIIFFLDDDVTVPNNYLEFMLSVFSPKTYSSAWAFLSLIPQVWQGLTQLRVGGGDHADYCGTGAAMIDASLFLHPDLLELPSEYKSMEDVWLCYVASTKAGFTLRGYTPQGVFVAPPKGPESLFKRNRALYKDFYVYLRNKGWKMLDERSERAT